MQSRLICYLFPLLLFTAPAAFGQPVNDECENAIPIDQVRSFCSEVGAFSNEGTTDPTTYDPATCFSGSEGDVWFTFVPEATTVTISVIGNEPASPGGTLNNPEVALYSGACGGRIDQMRCGADRENNIVEITRGGLTVGEPLLIRVRGQNGRQGTFQLCINNFNPPVEPGQDCFDAAILCNKDGFTVQKVFGPGEDPTEADDAACVSGGQVESSSTWFTWTAATSGTLEFTLSPINRPDDLDFVLYELPNGPLDCSNKVQLRCMMSGDFTFPSPCMGPTGLRNGSTDIGEPAGCNNPNAQDNFLAPLDMVEGVTYALFVNNFSDSGNGFEIEFGGTGTFQGPQADFIVDEIDRTVCVGEPISFTDASTFDFGSIVDQQWQFGAAASLDSTAGPGPHDISYSTAGVKSIALTVTSDRGCVVTAVENITVECCSDHFNVDGQVSDIRCPDGEGAIDLNVDNDFGPYAFGWSNDAATEDISNVPAGMYDVTISDAATCDTVVSFEITAPEAFEFDTLFTRPTCDGGADGAITLEPSGATPPYQYNWENGGFVPDNNLSNIPAGDYEVTVRDQNDCTTDLVIPLRELQLQLVSDSPPVSPPSCTGFSDGAIIAQMANGRPQYEYNWNDGRGFQDNNTLDNLTAGVYELEVLDADRCRGFFTFEIEDPPPLELNFDATDVSCNGDTDGAATALIDGGVGGYSFQWTTGDAVETITDLPVGAYTVTVLDANDCDIEGTVNINEPPPLQAELQNVSDVVCFGDSTGQIAFGGVGGAPPYEFSLDGQFFQSGANFSNLPAATYELFVQDANGCLSTTTATVSQPPELILDAGPDQTINLGFTTGLRAVASEVNVDYTWQPPDSLSCLDCPNPTARPAETTLYRVQAVNADGCVALDSVLVRVEKVRPIFIPNAFSPNGDGNNDFFTLYGGPAIRRVRKMQVFNRWGGLVFDGENIPLNSESAGWDGTFRGEKLNSGVFVYAIEVEFVDDEVRLFRGDVTLVR